MGFPSGQDSPYLRLRMERHSLRHFLPTLKVLLVILLFFVGLSLIPGVGRWIGKVVRKDPTSGDAGIVHAETRKPATTDPSAPPRQTIAGPTKSADRDQAELKGPSIPPEELDKWLTMPKAEWLPLLNERTATLPAATRQELVDLMDQYQGLMKSGLGATHPTAQASRNLIVQKSYSRFEGLGK